MRDFHIDKRSVIPGAIACAALLGLGLEAGSRVGADAAATGQVSVYTTTVSGRTVTVDGKAPRIVVPATTIRRNGRTVTIPAHTVAVTDTRLRTVSVPVTVTGPVSTATTTQTVTGPVTTVLESTTDIVTVTVTVPPAS